MAKTTLLDHVPIPADHVHRMRGELPDAREAAADYERTLHSAFDVMLLGVGEDAHIASIFPASELLDTRVERPTRRRVAAIWVPHLDAWRITLTPDAILDSRAIVVLVAGANKADAVHAALHEPLDVHEVSRAAAQSAGDRVEWFVDRAAAARL